MRDAEGMVKGTRLGWLGPDSWWSTSQGGPVAKGECAAQAGAPEAHPVSRFRGSVRPSERDGVLLQRHRSRPPEEVAAEASSEVAPLKDALRVVRAKSKVPPVNERVEACKGFIERAKKRLTRTEAVISRAHEQKSIFEAEVRDGEARLLQLQAEFDAQPEPVGAQNRPVGSGTRCVEGPSKAASRGLDGRWSSNGVERCSTNARRPSGFRRVAELLQLRIAERFGVRGHSHGCESGNGHVRPGRAHGRAGEVLSVVCFDRSSRGQEKVHRHHTDRWESGVRQSRYGLRDVRVGEAQVLRVGAFGIQLRRFWMVWNAS